MKRLLLACVGLLPGAALACEPPGAAAGWTRVASNGTVIAFATRPVVIPMGEPFEMDIAVCADKGSAEAPRVDAWMPAHRHGMNYRPSVTAVAPGRYAVSGLLFHMGGKWEFRFDVPVDGKVQRLTAPAAIE